MIMSQVSKGLPKSVGSDALQKTSRICRKVQAWRSLPGLIIHHQRSLRDPSEIIQRIPRDQKVLRALRKHPESTKRTLREHSENTQGALIKHAEKIQRTRSQHSENTQRTLRKHSESTQRTLRKHSENTQRSLRKHSENTQKALRKHSQLTQKTLREHPLHFLFLKLNTTTKSCNLLFVCLS